MYKQLSTVQHREGTASLAEALDRLARLWPEVTLS